MICDHLRRARPTKILNVFQRIRLRFFQACGLASAHTSFASSRTAMSHRLLAIDNHGKPFAVEALDLCGNQAGGNPGEIRLDFGGPLRECFMPADVFVSELDRFTEGVSSLFAVPFYRPAILAMPVVNSVAPPSILFY
jgi:hypothetical protein